MNKNKVGVINSQDKEKQNPRAEEWREWCTYSQ